MSSESPTNAKISGYLEKKCKLRMVSPWKKYWFVLEGRLLLYYRSKAEYEAIGPCKGSITLGPSCNIKPALVTSCIFQIETRTNTITLRAESRLEQDKWMHGILTALNQSSGKATKMTHFRYSADDLLPSPTENNTKSLLSRHNTLPERFEKLPQHPNKSVIERMQNLGAHSYGGSLNAISKLSMSPKLPKNDNLKRLLQSSNDELVMYATVNKTKEKEDEIAEVVMENTEYVGLEPGETDEFVVENAEYVTSGDDEDTSKVTRDHVYQEILTKRELIQENSEDVNDYTGSGPLYRATKIYDIPIYSDISSDQAIYEETMPALPPRVQHLVAVQAEETSGEKNKKQKSKKMSFKRNSFVIKMLKKIRKHDVVTKEEISEPVKKPKEEVNTKDLQILNELQSLLETKKQFLEEKLKHSRAEKAKFDEELKTRIERKNMELEYSKPINGEKVLPTLPPKLKCSITEQPLTLLNIPRPKLKRIRHSNENIPDKLKTIDEILDELDNERTQPSANVKELIDKFNVGNSNHEEVEMRKKPKSPVQNCTRYSDDLNKLLAELSKVTNAPILQPGVTTSLVTTSLTDEEVLLLRKRRLSEPDYDIPRPHSSLLFRNQEPAEDAMKPTRFFGPVIIGPNNIGDASDRTFSIAPDSLEVHVSRNGKEDERSVFSYNSHTYMEIKTLDRKLSREEIYARPTSLTATDFDLHEDHFEDSLEPIEFIHSV
ncbi:PREDICTED: RB1-inducible coiled-coil protein 1-like isoform X2 [Nicrophorus vespilloides]|uniref:RB1-inducible coiled-coil protein 1-like isoform X2 n=1 Tax=Nicrophorus vespilloides TaxID=110193 RepID=A0ABM1M9N9_NICVS|nr:PREDICTED: RB1-inducible coiled-coil protein 1-like isoform X2 [Nicrophorus vespilloides]